MACRACGEHIVYPQSCPACGLPPRLVETAQTTPPLPLPGEAGWHVRAGDPARVERYWDGRAWTREIRGGEKLEWLERLTTLPEAQRTPYTEDQIDLLLDEVDRIRNLALERPRRPRPVPRLGSDHVPGSTAVRRLPTRAWFVAVLIGILLLVALAMTGWALTSPL